MHESKVKWGETYEAVSKQEHPRKINVPKSDTEWRVEQRQDQMTESETVSRSIQKHRMFTSTVSQGKSGVRKARNTGSSGILIHPQFGVVYAAHSNGACLTFDRLELGSGGVSPFLPSCQRCQEKISCAKKYRQTLSGDTKNSLVPPSERFCHPSISLLLEKLHNRIIKLPEIELTVFRTHSSHENRANRT
jgi:hypothetical protein